jgi:hypothetical protein
MPERRCALRMDLILEREFFFGGGHWTSRGHGINTSLRLAVIDDQPREEFSPRQRHTLKEFAASKFLLSSFPPSK